MSNLANVGDFCPNEDGSDHGKTNAGNIIKHGTTPKGLQRYRCKTCGRTFSERLVLYVEGMWLGQIETAGAVFRSRMSLYLHSTRYYAPAVMTDSEIITLSIMQEGRSNDSELSSHRGVQKDYLHLFPDLISRSRYHRRRKDLMGIQREMLRVLMNRLRLLAMWLALDSAPLITAESPRWKSARMSI